MVPNGSVPAVRQNTLLGLIAILLWSTTIAFSRSLTEQLGTFTTAALIYTLAGFFGLLYLSLQSGGISSLRKLPRLYLFGCGALFVAYITLLYLAIGFAANRTQVLTIGLINYLWPGFSLMFSIPILGRKAKPLLPAGILIAFGGIWLSTYSGSNLSSLSIISGADSWVPYGLALLASISWGLYTNLSRRWAANHDGGGVPLFLLASGLLLTVFRLTSPETAHWSQMTGIHLAYMALLPGMLAYILWDIAVRKGEIILVASLSYLTPLLSTVISALVLKVQPGPALWLGAALVFIGALVCKISVEELET